MSSTNRGTVRNERDLYKTPESAFDLMLPLLPDDVGFWEPACGDGRLIHMMRAAGLRADGADLQPDSAGYKSFVPRTTRDFLQDTTPREFILTNPPFSLAVEFVDHARKHAPEVMMLLPLNWLGSQRRHYWFRKFGIDAQFILSERPDFTGEGGDSNEYAWMYWGPRAQGIIWPEPTKPFRKRRGCEAPFLLWPEAA